MCPACVATMASIVAGATSTGGLAAFVTKKLRDRLGTPRGSPETNFQGEDHGHTKGKQVESPTSGNQG